MDAKNYRAQNATTKDIRDYEKNGQENFHSIIEADMVREFSRATRRFYLRPATAEEGSIIRTEEGREIGSWT